jgi:hypothetical protein
VTLKLDRFTWAVLGIVVLLLGAAIVTVNLSGGQGWGEPDYVDENTPSAPVRNAFVAFQRGDIGRARAQYTRDALEEADSERGYGPFRDEPFYHNDNVSRRLRIVNVEVDPQDPDRAYITVVQDNYSNSGLFGGGSTWSNRRTIEVVREEDGAWKIDSLEFFY